MFKGSFDRKRSVKAATAVVAAAVITFVSVGDTNYGYVIADDYANTYEAVSAMKMHEVVSNKSAGFGRLETVESLEMAHTVKGDKIYEQAMSIASSVSEISNLEIRKAEELQRIAEEEQAAIKAEEERKAAEEAARKAAEEEAKRIAEEEARRIAEEEARRIAEEQATKESVPEAVPSTDITYTYNVPSGANSAFKAYMSYRAVTCKSSPQYKLLNHELAYTDPNTGIRMYDGRYCIAMGSGYTTLIGQKIDLYLESGVVIPCILGDCKADCHTNWDTHQYCVTNGSVAEFIVDNSVFGYLKDGSGTVNWCVGECGSFAGKIVSVVLVD